MLRFGEIQSWERGGDAAGSAGEDHDPEGRPSLYKGQQSLQGQVWAHQTA